MRTQLLTLTASTLLTPILSRPQGQSPSAPDVPGPDLDLLSTYLPKQNPDANQQHDASISTAFSAANTVKLSQIPYAIIPTDPKYPAPRFPSSAPPARGYAFSANDPLPANASPPAADKAANDTATNLDTTNPGATNLGTRYDNAVPVTVGSNAQKLLILWYSSKKHTDSNHYHALANAIREMQRQLGQNVSDPLHPAGADTIVPEKPEGPIVTLFQTEGDSPSATKDDFPHATLMLDPSGSPSGNCPVDLAVEGLAAFARLVVGGPGVVMNWVVLDRGTVGGMNVASCAFFGNARLQKKGMPVLADGKPAGDLGAGVVKSA